MFTWWDFCRRSCTLCLPQIKESKGMTLVCRHEWFNYWALVRCHITFLSVTTELYPEKLSNKKFKYLKLWFCESILLCGEKNPKQLNQHSILKFLTCSTFFFTSFSEMELFCNTEKKSHRRYFFTKLTSSMSPIQLRRNHGVKLPSVLWNNQTTMSLVTTSLHWGSS